MNDTCVLCTAVLAVCARGFDTDEGVEDFKAVLARKVDALHGSIEECTAASE